MRERLRVGVDGKLFGMLPVHWTLIARWLSPEEAQYAAWLCGWLDGRTVSAGPLRGNFFANVGSEG